MEYCRLNGVSLQAWSPVDRGVLVTVQRDTLSAEEQHTAQVLRPWLLSTALRRKLCSLHGFASSCQNPARTGHYAPDRLATYATALDVVLSREDWYELFEAARGRSMP